MKRITVLLENHPGVVADITRILAAAAVNIETFDIDAAEQTGVLNLTVDRYDTALQTLRDGGYRAITEDALVVQLHDEPGALARVAEKFKSAQINIRSMHILKRARNTCLVSIVCEQKAKAADLIREWVVS